MLTDSIPSRPLRLLLISANRELAGRLRALSAGEPAPAFSVQVLPELDRARIAAASTPDVLLLDLSVAPWTSKTAVLRSVHQAVPGRPLIVLGPADDDLLADMLLRAGAQEYLTVDAPGQALQRAIRQALARHQAQHGTYPPTGRQEVPPESRNLHQYARRLKMLSEVSQSVLAARSPQAVAHAILHYVKQTIECQQAMVTLLDFDTGQAQRLVRLAGDGRSPSRIETFPLADYGDLEALRLGRPLHIPDLANLAERPAYLLSLLQDGLRAYLCLPLRAQGQPLGMLSLAAATPGHFSDEAVEIAREVAGPLAMAIHNAYLTERLRQQADELRQSERDARLLNEITNAAASIVDFDEMMQTLAAKMRDVIAADYCIIDLWDSERQQVRPAVACSPQTGGHVRAACAAESTGLTRNALQTGQTLLLTDVLESELVGSPPRPVLPARSLLVIPLLATEEPLGAVQVAFEQLHSFSAEEIGRCERAAGQIGLAIAKAQLFEATRRQLEEFKVLRTLAAAGARATSEDWLLTEATQLIAEALYSDNFGILMLDEATGELVAHHAYRSGPHTQTITAVPLGQGISGTVALTGQSWRVGDVAQEASYLKLDLETRSELCVPIAIGQQVIGVINAESRELNAFTSADERLLTTFARQLATAIEKIRLLEAERRRRQEAETLREASVALSATLNVDQVLQRILVQLGQLVTYGSAAVLLVEGERLVVAAAIGFPAHLSVLGRDFPANNPLFTTVRTSRQPLWLADVHQDPRFVPWDGFEYIRAWMGIPLIVRGEVMGMLTIDSGEPGAYTAVEARLAYALASQAAVAVENARLFEATQQRMNESQLLSDVLRQMNAVPDISEAFPQVATSLRRISDCRWVSLAFLDETQGWVTMIALDQPRAVLREGTRFPVSATSAAKDVLAGQIHLTPNLAAETDYPAEKALWDGGARSRVNLPLQVEGRVLGALNLVWTETNGCRVDLLPLLMQIAEALALAWERHRLFEETRRRASQLAALHATQLDIAAEHDLSALLQTMVERATSLLETAAGGLYLCDPERRQVRCVVSYQNTEDYTGLELAYGEGAAGYVAETGQPLIVDDYSRWEHRSFKISPQERLRAILAVPMRWQGQVTGVLLAMDRQIGRFKPKDLELLTLFGNQAAIALQNARLIDRIRRRAKELELLLDLSSSLRLLRKTEEMVELVQSTVGGIIGDAQVAIYLSDGASGDRAAEIAAADSSPTAAPVVLALPLSTEQAELGRLVVRPWPERPLTSRETRLLTAVANLAASALQRAQVLETLEQRVIERTYELAQANEQLKELDKLKSKFVSDVSHELRTPITNLKLYLELLQNGKPDRRERYLKVLQQESDRLGTLIEDILNLSRFDLGKTAISFAAVDLNRLVEPVLAIYQPRAETGELALRFLSEEPLLLASAEPNQMTQVLTHLLVNALTYTPRGWVEVRTGYDAERGQLFLEVADSGVGIDPADLPHLRERFYRGAYASQSNIPGNGLGLAIVDEIVKLHQGELVIKSELGVGTAVRVWLWPAVDHAEGAAG